MNYTTTVLKQTLSSPSSASGVAAVSQSSSSSNTRMSPNIAISTSAQFATKTVTKSATIAASFSSQSVRFGSKRTSILMASNSCKTKAILNQLMPECARDKRLFDLLTSVPDEPLYPHQQSDNITQTIDHTQNEFTINGNDSVQVQQTACTSSFGADDFENLPPSTNTEDGANDVMELSTTPVNKINHPQMHLIQRDLNSPSANNRMRAIRALKDPSIKYYNFDVPHEEQEIITDEDRLAAVPKTIQEVLKDVVVYVEVRYGADNRTAGVKNVISRMGAKVNDRLLKNTTHVIFKDGLHSTYNKAKSWNIPIVSILWIEACRNHLVVMDPRGYPISNIEQYENPWLYGKIKRVKTINFGTDDKVLIKRPLKVKLLESLKDNVVPPSPKTPPKTKRIDPLMAKVPGLPASIVTTNSRKSLGRSSITKKPATSSQSRKTMNGCVEKPKNTIESMFQKQMEKSQSSQSPISVQLAALDLTNDMNVVPNSPKPTEHILAPGSLHKRVTRRNSITLTPVGSDEKTSVVTPTIKPSSRKTMFTPRVSDVIEEDKLHSTPVNKTVNQSALMDIVKCNNVKMGQNATSFSATTTEDINQKRQLLQSLGRRKTFYTPQSVDETLMVESRMTPPVNRTCLKFTLDDTPGTQDLVKKSTHAPNNTRTTSYDWSKGMPKLELNAFGNALSSKTLIDEYANTFSSKKIPVAPNRRTLSHISMDIINQRIENLNRNASLHRSRNDSIDNRYSDIDADNNDCDSSPSKPLDGKNGLKNDSTPDGIKPKPLKRKLFAPPSMFPSIDLSPTLMTDTPTNKTAKNVNKRNRDVFSPLTSKSSPQSTAASKKMTEKRTKKTCDAANNNAITAKKTTKQISRRSTMHFESAEKIKLKNERNIVGASNGTATISTPPSVMVFTNMHHTQIDVIKEAVAKLGKFIIEKNVSEQTTHVVSLENRRTINLIRGIIRGLWILNYDWIEKSLTANDWQPEELYELKTFSKAVEICRMERQAFGKHFKMDLFSEVGPIFISSDCRCDALSELIKLCRGKITKNRSMAKYIVVDRVPNNSTAAANMISSNWILDSISIGKLLRHQIYRLTNIEKKNGKENAVESNSHQIHVGCSKY